jgi:hypothetical protein
MTPIFRNTDIVHDKSELTTQQQASLLKKRIEDMKKGNTNLYIGQPAATQSDDECYMEIAASCKKFINDPSEKNETELAQTLEKHNLQLYCYPADRTSDDKKNIARMAFNGYVDRPQEYQLSSIVRDMKNKPAERAKTQPDDYNLANSSTWNVFKQVPEFAAIEDKVKKGLSTLGIPPERLAELKVKDFCYIINEQMRSASNGGAARVFNESYKARNTKRFIEENEEEFRAGLMAMPGVKKEYVKTLIRAMKKGITDLTKYKEDGKPVWKDEWANQPVLDVHHIVNIKDSATKEAQGKSWTNINDYENMCFIVRYPQHDAMHALEQDLQGNYHDDVFRNRKIGKDTFYRIQPPEGVRCMLGFHNMIYDRKYLGLSEKEKSEIKDKAENDKNRISGSYGRNNWHGHPKNDPYAQRKDWKQERMDYVRR